MKRISFFGATGMLGKPMVQEFIKRGYQVVALTRNMDKALKLFPDSVNWIHGDLSQNEKIDETILGSDLIYINLAVDPLSSESDFQPEREGLSSILRSAKWHNASRIVFMSSLVKSYQGMNNYDWWVFEIKQQAIDRIKRSGIPYIIFNPSTFMENYTEGGFISENKILVVGKSKHPNWLIAADDYAKMAIKAIETLESDENKEYIIQGPEGFTLDKAAALFSRSYTRSSLKINNYPLFIVKFAGLFNRKYNYGARIMEAMNNYPESFQSEDVWQELGKPITTFNDFIQSRNQVQDNVEQEMKE
jgi:uncharacterized protein YbjT (DUF2867 family)